MANPTAQPPRTARAGSSQAGLMAPATAKVERGTCRARGQHIAPPAAPGGGGHAAHEERGPDDPAIGQQSQVGVGRHPWVAIHRLGRRVDDRRPDTSGDGRAPAVGGRRPGQRLALARWLHRSGDPRRSEQEYRHCGRDDEQGHDYEPRRDCRAARARTQGGCAHARRGEHGCGPRSEVTRGRHHHDDTGQPAHGQRPPRRPPAPGRNDKGTRGQGEQGPMALRPDEGRHQETQRSAHERSAQIERQAENERHREQRRRRPGKGERRRQLPERTNVLGQRTDLPEHTNHAEGRRDRSDRDKSERDARAVVIVESLDHQIGGEKAEHGRTERQEGGRSMHRLGPHEPPQRQSAEGHGRCDGQPVPEADQRDDRKDP